MTSINISGTVTRIILAVFISLSLPSCVRDGMDECGVYLEFLYDHNMEYADSFDPNVNAVDVFVFDSNGRYLFSKRSLREQLIGGKRMSLGEELPLGRYKVLTVGGLSSKFQVTDSDGDELTPGTTAIEDVRIALKRESPIVSEEFPSLWVGKAINIEYRADISVWPVYLIKDTNKFNLLLSESGNGRNNRNSESRQEGTAPCTFEIIVPEGEVYDCENSPIIKETVIHTPYYLAPGEGPGELSQGRINTMRLIYGNDYEYRLIVRHVESKEVLWDYDLMKLLKYIKPASRPDGTTLPMQEFLDRQSEWNIVILYDGDISGDPGAFIAVAVEINNWIIWLHDIEI